IFTVQIKQLIFTRDMNDSEKISTQRKMVFEGESKVVLFAPCKIGEGIIQLNDSEWVRLSDSFVESKTDVTYFIPASGSGSRMFQFLYDFIDAPNERNFAEVERFMNHIEEFAFFQLLPNDLKEKV